MEVNDGILKAENCYDGNTPAGRAKCDIEKIKEMLKVLGGDINEYRIILVDLGRVYRELEKVKSVFVFVSRITIHPAKFGGEMVQNVINGLAFHIKRAG